MTLLRCRIGGLGTKRNSAYLKLQFRVWSVLRLGGGSCQYYQEKRQVKESREEPRVDLEMQGQVFGEKAYIAVEKASKGNE